MPTMNNEYTELIQGYHKDKPLFTEWVYALTEPLLEARRRLANMPALFDVDNAVGDQLDAVGRRVGIGRELPVIIKDVFFAFDDKDGYGFDHGVWRGRFDAVEGVNAMDDDMYRTVILSKIKINHWNGSNAGLIDFMNGLCRAFGVPEDTILVYDRQDMNVEISLRTEIIPKILRTLLTKRLINFVPAGVGVEFLGYKPRFGFDRQDERVQGFGVGLWSNKLTGK